MPACLLLIMKNTLVHLCMLELQLAMLVFTGKLARVHHCIVRIGPCHAYSHATVCPWSQVPKHVKEHRPIEGKRVVSTPKSPQEVFKPFQLASLEKHEKWVVIACMVQAHPACHLVGNPHL